VANLQLRGYSGIFGGQGQVFFGGGGIGLCPNVEPSLDHGHGSVNVNVATTLITVTRSIERARVCVVCFQAWQVILIINCLHIN